MIVTPSAVALGQIRGTTALLVGDAMLDAYLLGETVRVSREAPVLVVRKQRSEYRLGGAANTGANLAALGVATEFLGCLGEDTAGDQILDQLRTAAVQVAHVQRSERTTSQKTRVLAGAVGTAKQQVLRIDEEASEPHPPAAIERLAQTLERRVAALAPDVVVVSDYGLGTVQGPVIEVIRALAKAGQRVCVDSRYNLPAYGGVSAITPNIPEAEAVVGFPIHDQDTAERAGKALMERLELDCCLLTQGQHGMTLFARGDDTADHIPIVGSDEVADVTGAGDTVISTFSACLAAGLPPAVGMRMANCAAGVVVTKLGTAAASPAEISTWVADYGVDLKLEHPVDERV